MVAMFKPVDEHQSVFSSNAVCYVLQQGSVDHILESEFSTKGYWTVVLSCGSVFDDTIQSSSGLLAYTVHCDIWYENILSFGTAYYATQGGSSFGVYGWNPKAWVPFEQVDKYWAVPSCGTVYWAVQGGSTLQSVDEILKNGHWNER